MAVNDLPYLNFSVLTKIFGQEITTLIGELRMQT
jgi:hypothetical protein